MSCILSQTLQVSFDRISLHTTRYEQGFLPVQSQEHQKFGPWRLSVSWRESSEAYMPELSAISAIQVTWTLPSLFVPWSCRKAALIFKPVEASSTTPILPRTTRRL